MVSQPVRNDPLQVTVNWGTLIQNARCVDQFTVYYWPEGTLKTGARRVTANNTAVSATVAVEACLNYRFRSVSAVG